MENPEQNISVLGLSRLRRDYYKGMSPKELQQYTQYQLQQAEDRKVKPSTWYFVFYFYLLVSYIKWHF